MTASAEPTDPPSAGITFRVLGMEPAPQGSKSPKGRTRTGKAVLVESCKRVKPWRERVTDAAVAAGVPLMRGPVTATMTFVFRRPAGHFKANGQLKPSAPRWHCVRPDGSKLMRSTEDALSKVLYEDDSRIVFGAWEKRYCVDDREQPGAIITILPLPT